ncbi:phosphopyruvate hydratase [Burkholderiaceae bacterium FT117]|uniref:phosphopyruvate hydratase n=1 Tax=Zeimonas sediminis TaxID=2944268 RepID=UPI00234322C0|nr:phosphopyruvate hydratase [Zeimonas sediminis]MCM5569591.1 phosphopyruvate hydratase [Zeimonas sediminis]
MTATSIRALRARQVLDSRGRPTVEVDVALQGGAIGRASVPSGASTGAAEAHELRDGDPARYGGLGVRRAVANANGEIAAALRGFDACDQRGLDARLRELDGTPQLERLGANAVLGVSLAACRAAAAALGQPLYRRLAELSGTDRPTMPMPMVNILSGGLHAGRGMDVQDFLAVPASASSIEEAIDVVSRVRMAATGAMAARGLSTLLADEGGLSPGLATGREALELMIEAIARAGLEPGRDVAIAIDVAATSLKGPAPGVYRLAREGRDATSDEMIEMTTGWVRDFPVVSIEDALDEEDWAGWRRLTERLGGAVQLVGDDLFTTNPARVDRGIAEGVGNGVLVKLNQNGTLSGTLDVIERARRAGYAPVVSARSGETEDPFIADLAVGTAAGQIKIGSVRCGERMAKYNQLLRIEEESGAPFAGIAALSGRR